MIDKKQKVYNMSFNLSTPNKKSKFGLQESIQPYIAHLEEQVSMRDQAIRKAEHLISLYRRENQAIKEQNRHLKDALCYYEGLKTDKQIQQTNKQYKKTIKTLLQQKLELLQIINLHQSQIRYLTENKSGKGAEQKRQKSKIRLKTSHAYETAQYQPQRLEKQLQSEQAAKNRVEKMLEQKLQVKNKEVLQLMKKIHALQNQCDLAQSLKDFSQNPEFLQKTPKKAIPKTIRKGSNSHYLQTF